MRDFSNAVQVSAPRRRRGEPTNPYAVSSSRKDLTSTTLLVIGFVCAHTFFDEVAEDDAVGIIEAFEVGPDVVVVSYAYLDSQRFEGFADI